MVSFFLCCWVSINFIFNNKNLIMANREKFLHNHKKAKRQRKMEKHALNNIFEGYSKGLIDITKINEQK
tara:strand:+ start:271 stop:477 length:207 start_codon:yes stop_codon:yes gene_type:complete